MNEVQKKQIVDKLVKAVCSDLKESYPSLTYEWLREEADKQLAGNKPTGGPGMFLNDYLREAHLLIK